MKKNNKGFTLIELLVVVAIIGILAAVGVVAYSGYTSGAKKQAAKSNHSAVAKYIAAELQKCNIGEDKAMEDHLDCSGNTATATATAAAKALKDFKNPYKTQDPAVQTTGDITADTDVGFVRVIGDNGTSKVTVKVCIATKCNSTDNQVSTEITVE